MKMKKMCLFCLALLLVLATDRFSAWAESSSKTYPVECSLCGSVQQFVFMEYLLVSDGSPGGPGHTKVYVHEVQTGGEHFLYVTTPHEGGTATCTKKAVCTVCGYEYGHLADHEYVTHKAQAATCTEVGWKSYKICKHCGDKQNYEEIAALGHNTVSHAGRDATCTEDGWEAYVTCTRCSYTTYKKISALGHE